MVYYEYVGTVPQLLNCSTAVAAAVLNTTYIWQCIENRTQIEYRRYTAVILNNILGCSTLQKQPLSTR